MDRTSPHVQPPSKKNLENYAVSYLGAYLNTVQKERPDRMPTLARNQPSEIEVCVLPNNCFAMIFDRSEKQKIAVADRDWGYLEGKAYSGAVHMVAVYAHEGVSLADAISKGKKDAIRDIRAIEESNITKASLKLEKMLNDLIELEKGNKSVVRFAEAKLSRLEPIKEMILNSSPDIDMPLLVEALRNYPAKPVEVGLADSEKKLLMNIGKDIEDLSDVIRKSELQDEKLEELEQSLKKTIAEMSRSVDERIAKGLAVILSSSDRKIDKGLAALSESARADIDEELPKELEVRLENLEKVAQVVEMQAKSGPPEPRQPPKPRVELPKDVEVRFNRVEQIVDKIEAEFLDRPDVSEEMVRAIAEIRADVGRINQRIIKIEEFVLQMVPAKQRVLKQK